MTTIRYYLDNATPSWTPTTLKGTWNRTTSLVNRVMDTTKAGIQATASSTGHGVNPSTTASIRFVSPALSEAYIVDFLNAVIAFMEANANANYVPVIHCYVSVGETDSVRGTIVSNWLGPQEFGMNSTTRIALALDPTSTQRAAYAGDHIVVEVGWRQTSTSTSAGYVYHGGSASDLVAGDSGTTVTGSGGKVAWIDFDLTPITLTINSATVGLSSTSCDVTDPFTRQTWYANVLYTQALEVSNATVGMTGGSADVGSTHVLVVNNATVGLTAPEVAVTTFSGTTQTWYANVATGPALEIDSATIGLTSPEVDITQYVTYTVTAYPTHVLAINGADVGLSASSCSVSSSSTLAINSATVGLSSSVVPLTQTHILAVNGASVALTAPEVTVTTGNVTLAISNATIGLTAGSVALTQIHVIGVANATIGLSATSCDVTDANRVTLAINGASIGLTTSGLSLTQRHILGIDSASVVLRSDEVSFALPPGTWVERDIDPATWTERPISSATWSKR